MTKIDPILPLAVQIAEGRGQFAFFLGSGVSRPAGIPSGWEVRQKTLTDLYRLQEEVEEIDNEKFEKWLNDTGFIDVTYSSIIDELRPDKPQQREYLANFFKGKEPTEAHKTLARLVKQNMVRVITTTNFDPLMEKALDELGISYSVVTPDTNLKNVEPREHSICRIVKPHGDWQELNLRNSDKEVAELPELLENELCEIFNRYGLVIMGYGAYEKERLVELLKRRCSPYGLYWLVRSEPEKSAQEIVERQDGRFIERESADAFMSELGRKIQLFLERPKSRTPEMTANEFILLLRQDDRVGIEQLVDDLIQQVFEVSDEAEGHLKKDCKRLLKEGRINWKRVTEEGTNVILQAAEPLFAVGIAAIHHNAFDAFEYILQKVLRLLFERSTDNLRRMNGVVAVILFIGWGMYCLQREEFVLMRNLFELKVQKGKRVGRLDEFREFYNIHPNGELVHRFAVEKFSKIAWFKDKFDLDYSVDSPFYTPIMEFDLIHSLWLSAQSEKEEGDSSSFTLKPAFFGSDRKSRIDPIIVKIEGDKRFCETLAEEIFDEDVEEFREKLSVRYEDIKEKTRVQNISVGWNTYARWPGDNI